MLTSFSLTYENENLKLQRGSTMTFPNYIGSCWEEGREIHGKWLETVFQTNMFCRTIVWHFERLL